MKLLSLKIINSIIILKMIIKINSNNKKIKLKINLKMIFIKKIYFNKI